MIKFKFIILMCRIYTEKESYGGKNICMVTKIVVTYEYTQTNIFVLIISLFLTR